MRIAVGGFLHETHSFAPVPTRLADFRRPGGFPPLQRGPALLAALRGTSVPCAGAIGVAEEAKVDLAALTWCLASPAGPIEDEAFETIAAMICADIATALECGGVDGIYLDLHGAALNVTFPDAEGELLRRVRAITGPDLPLTVSLDPHANLTPGMIAHADAVVPFRTYPHVDMPVAGGQAMRLLIERIQRGRPWGKALRQIDFFLPLGSQCTLMAPMKEIMAERAAMAVAMDCAELAFCFGFPYADFHDCGAAVAAFAEDDAAATRAADAFAALVNGREMEFRQGILPAAEAVRAAMDANVSGPVVIADTQDNPGGGGHGDTTGLLAELVRQRAAGAVLCLINDAASAAACHAAGVGARVRLSLGGKSDATPFGCEATVENLTDGRFTLTGPMGKGNPASLGGCALIRIEPGVRVVVVSRKMQALDQAILRHVGIEPTAVPILVLKSSVHFRADFAPIASRIIVAAAPGPVVADPAVLPFRHLRPGLRLRPGANQGSALDGAPGGN